MFAEKITGGATTTLCDVALNASLPGVVSRRARAQCITG